MTSASESQISCSTPGYYKFHKDFIQFDADTVSTENNVNIKLHLLKFRSSNDAPETMHPRYSIGKIRFSSDQGKLQLRHSVLDNATQLEEGQPYSYSALEDTYRNFGRLSAVRYTSIQFREEPDTTLLDCEHSAQYEQTVYHRFPAGGHKYGRRLGSSNVYNLSEPKYFPGF